MSESETPTRWYDLSEKDHWQTPPELVADLRAGLGGIDLDPCAGKDTEIGATNYTIEDDGLTQEWFGRVFINPPFSYKEEWLAKTVEEIDSGNAENGRGSDSRRD